MTRRLAAVLLVSASPAFAQGTEAPEPAPAGTAEGAKAIVDGLVPYVGRGAFDNGTLKVAPDPAGYRLTVDPKPLVEAAKTKAASFEMAPFSFVVSRRDDGNWNYFTDARLDVRLRYALNGMQQDIAYAFGPQSFKGVYSPAIASFLSGAGSVDGLTMTTSDPNSDVSARFGRASATMTGSPAEGGAANLSMQQAIEGFSEKVTLKQGPDLPPGGIAFDVKAAKGTTNFDVAAIRSRPLLDLYSFFVTHPEYVASTPDKAKLAASQDDLKTRLRAALPLWNRLNGDYLLSDVEFGSQFGTAKAERFTFVLATDGVSKAGSLHYAFGFGGFSVASPSIPAWAVSLIPGEMDLRFRMDNLDLQTPADILLADFDLSRGDVISAEAEQRMQAAFAENPPRFVIEPSRIKSQDLELAMTGSFATSAGKPAATVDITATGLEKTISTLQSAAQSQPEINQVVGGLSMAKGFGKTLPDGRVQWVVDASSDGSVKVNGFQIKGPDPVLAPPSDDGTGDEPDEEGIAPDGEVPMDQAPTDDNALPDSAPQQ